MAYGTWISQYFLKKLFCRKPVWWFTAIILIFAELTFKLHVSINAFKHEKTVFKFKVKLNLKSIV